MHRRPSKKVNDTPLRTNWVDYIQDDRLQGAVPIGPRFQADLPTLMLDYKDQNRRKYELESSKWLGTKIWDCKVEAKEDDDDVVGKGRPVLCPCEFSGDVECIKVHILIKRIKLQFDIRHAYTHWKFSEMGEDVSNWWTTDEQEMFEFIVKMNCTPEGIGFLKPALMSFPSQSWQNIVSYFFNVYLLRRIREQSRSGRIVDTDDEGPVEKSPVKDSMVRSSRRRLQARVGTSRGGRIGQTRFLAGKR